VNNDLQEVVQCLPHLARSNLPGDADLYFVLTPHAFKANKDPSIYWDDTLCRALVLHKQPLWLLSTILHGSTLKHRNKDGEKNITDEKAALPKILLNEEKPCHPNQYGMFSLH